MEPEQSFVSKLSETLSLIEEIKKQDSEINRVLDLIEEQQNISSKVESPDSESAGGNVAKPSCKSFHREGTPEEKPKGILKSPNLGSKDSFGFNEQFDLNESNVMYGSMLRRKYVSLNQDNRLCLRFGFQPNLGCVYESSVSANCEVAHVKKNNDPKSNSLLFPGHSGMIPEPVARGAIPHLSQGAVPKSAKSVHDVSNPQASQAPVRKTSGKVEAYQSAMSHEKLGDKCKRPTEKHAMEQLGAGEATLTRTQVLEMAENNWKEWKGQLKSVGVDVDDLKFNVPEMIANLSYKCNHGDLTLEDLMSIQKEMTDTLKELLKESGAEADETSKELVTQVQKAAEQATKVSVINENADIETLSTTASPPSPVEIMQMDSDCEDEPVFIDPAAWALYADKEVKNAKYARDIREKGLDTIFCLDMSSSMKGIGWEQAVEFIKHFIEGIQTFNLNDSVFEHVALVTFGGQTRVQQHLTCDYLEITRKLDGLRPCGRSPLYAGLQMVHAAVLGAGQVFSSNGYHMYPRVFLITDGKPTDSGQVNGPDSYSSLKPAEELNILAEVKLLSDRYHIKVNPIPVGSFDLSLLEKISKVSKGKIVSPEDWRIQTRAFKNYLAAARIDKNTVKNSPELISLLLNTVLSDASPEDQNQIQEFLIDSKEDSSVGDSYDDKEFPGLPPLGSRVRKSVPGLSIRQLSVGQIGTVTKHISRDQVGITWDVPSTTGGLHEQIEYSDTQRGVFVVDEPRVLKNELIAVGCRVQRGKDWRYDMQDGGPGNHGNVFDVEQNGVVKVRWDCGGSNTYRFGAEGKFDVEIINGQKQLKKTTKKDGDDTLDEEDVEKKHIQEMNERNKPPTQVSDKMGSADACGFSTLSSTSLVMSNNVEVDTSEKKTKSAEKDAGISRSVAGNPGSQGANGTSFSDVLSASSSTAGNVQWMWQDDGQWHPYPTDVNEKIESGYTNHPSRTCVITMENEQFRIVFSQMKQINIATRVKVAIKRSTER